MKENFENPKIMTEIELDYYKEYISSGIIGIYSNWLNTEDNISIERLTEIIDHAILAS